MPLCRMRFLWVVVCVLAVVCGRAPGQAFVVPIDEAQSSVTVELCILDNCDDDTSPASGYFEIALDDVGDPSRLAMFDFFIELTEDIELSVRFGFLGRFDATGEGIEVFAAEPGELIGPAAVDPDGRFELEDVPSDGRGVLNYTATGIVCVALRENDLNCEDEFDLSEGGAQQIESLEAVVTVKDGVLRLEGQFRTVQPIDPDDPELGEVTVSGNIVATADVSGLLCLPDLNNDGEVDIQDFFEFLDRFAVGDPSVDFTGTMNPSSEMYGLPDGEVDIVDFFYFLERFEEGC